MGDAGLPEDAPLLGRNRLLVADGQRGENPHVRRLRQGGAERTANVLAQALDRVTRPENEVVEPLRHGFRAHVAGRPQSTLEKPGLVVETVRVGVAVRPFQANGQPPALAGADGRRCGERRALRFVPLVGALAVVPGEHDPPRHTRLWRFDRLDDEGEALAVLEALRQAGDHPDELQITAFPFRRQALVQALPGKQRRPCHAQQSAGQQGEGTPDERRRLSTRARPKQPGRCAKKRRHDQRRRRQASPSLEKPDPHGEGKNVGAHAALNRKSGRQRAFLPRSGSAPPLAPGLRRRFVIHAHERDAGHRQYRRPVQDDDIAMCLACA